MYVRIYCVCMYVGMYVRTYCVRTYVLCVCMYVRTRGEVIYGIMRTIVMCSS